METRGIRPGCYHIRVRGIAAALVVSVISMITGCAAFHSGPPAAAAEPDPWADFHNGQEVGPSKAAPPPVAADDKPKTDAPPPPAKSDDGVDTDKTEEKLALAEEPAPKPAKHKAKAKRRRKSGGSLATKRARKRAPKPVSGSLSGS